MVASTPPQMPDPAPDAPAPPGGPDVPRPDRWMSAVEQIIEAGRKEGAFDDLAGTGKPIADIDQPHDPDRWAKQIVARERARDERDEVVESIDMERRRFRRLTTEGDVRRAVAAVNDRLRAVDSPSAPVPAATYLDADVEISAWRSARRSWWR